MKRILFIMFACLCCASIMAQTPKKKVAVYVSGDVEQAYKKIIGAKLVTGITASEGYMAVERTADFLSVLSQETDYQTSGEVSDNQIVKLGQRFGVRYVLVADLSELFGSLFASVRMIDAETGIIYLSTEASGEVTSMANLETISRTIVNNINQQDQQIRDQARKAEEQRLAEIRKQQEEEKNRREVPRWDVKQLGPFTNVEEFITFQVPVGYRPCTEEEVIKLMNYTNIASPAYVNVRHSKGNTNTSGPTHYYIDVYFQTIKRGYNPIKYDRIERIYYQSKKYAEVWKKTSDVLTPGYIYVIRT